MRTALTPERLAALHAEGRRLSSRSRFVDPHAVIECKRVLWVRGEEWAASVLLRDITRRSAIDPTYPWFVDGEMETLALADAAELWAMLSGEAQGD